MVLNPTMDTNCPWAIRTRDSLTRMTWIIQMEDGRRQLRSTPVAAGTSALPDPFSNSTLALHERRRHPSRISKLSHSRSSFSCHIYTFLLSSFGHVAFSSVATYLSHVSVFLNLRIPPFEVIVNFNLILTWVNVR